MLIYLIILFSFISFRWESVKDTKAEEEVCMVLARHYFLWKKAITEKRIKTYLYIFLSQEIIASTAKRLVVQCVFFFSHQDKTLTKDARDRANRPGDETGVIKLLSKNSRTGRNFPDIHDDSSSGFV